MLARTTIAPIRARDRGGMNTLAREINALPQPLTSELQRNGFSAELLLRLASTMGEDPDARNRLAEGVEAPLAEDLSVLPEPGSAAHADLEKRGLEALRRGELRLHRPRRRNGLPAWAVSSRLLSPAVGDKTFLDLRLAENAHWSSISGRPVPLWLMDQLRDRRETARGPRLEAARRRSDDLSQQNISVRLTEDGARVSRRRRRPEHHSCAGPRRPPRSASPQRSCSNASWLGAASTSGSPTSTTSVLRVDPVILGWHIRHALPPSASKSWTRSAATRGASRFAATADP